MYDLTASPHANVSHPEFKLLSSPSTLITTNMRKRSYPEEDAEWLRDVPEEHRRQFKRQFRRMHRLQLRCDASEWQAKVGKRTLLLA